MGARNSWSACLELGLEPITREYEGSTDTVSLVNFTISLNLNRRHLTKSQLATLAVEIEKVLAEAARERQRLAGEQFGRGKVNQKIDEPISQPQAAEQAAQIVGTNRQYVSDAKKIAQLAPDLFEEIRQGEISITDAKRERKERKRDDVRARRTPKRYIYERVKHPAPAIAQRIAPCSAALSAPSLPLRPGGSGFLVHHCRPRTHRHTR